MKKIILFFACLSAALFGCSKSESALKDMSGYSLLDYLPSQPGTSREYITYGTENEGGMISRDYLNSVEQTGTATDDTPIYTYDYEHSLFFTEEPSQTIDHKKTIDASENAIFELNTSGEKALLMKKAQWERDSESKIELIDANVDLSTKIGELSGCIEVLETVTEKSSKGVQVKEYHCPKIGKVSSYIKTSDTDEFKLFTELLYISIPGEPELGEQYVIGRTDELTKEEMKETEAAENPINSLISGVLPEKTGNISALDFYEYRDRVNEYSLESIGHHILHNPLNFIEDENDLLLEFDEGVSVLVEKETYLIKEISINQDYISETSFIYARDLILGLSEDVTTEQADKILYPEKEGATFNLEGFKIGHELGQNHFDFSAVAK